MKRWGSLAGSVAAAAGMALVLYLYGGDLRRIDWSNPAILPTLAVSLGFYVLVVVIGAIAWRILLRSAGAPNASWVAERQLLIAQIGKYLPGNFAQYLGRAAMAIKSGVPAMTVGVALAGEAAATVLGGLMCAVVSIAIAPEPVRALRKTLPHDLVFIWLFVAAGVVVAALLAIRLFTNVFQRVAMWPKIRFSGLLTAVLLYVLGFLILGLSFRLVASALSPNYVPYSLAIALFAASWIGGLATPGAPGGLGVRESVLTLGLAPVVGGPAALSAALVYRGVSVLGDMVAFGLGLLIKKDRPQEHCDRGRSGKVCL
jgi:glycosyltransferase 2 family protein